MMTTRRTSSLLCLFVFLAGACAAPVAAPAADDNAKARPACHALLVGGLPGWDLHARHWRDWLTRFDAYLTGKAGLAEENVTLLTGDKGFKSKVVDGVATRKSVLAAIAKTAADAGPEDQFILVMLGLGGSGIEDPTFILPGPDLGAEALKEALKAIPCANQVVLNLSAAGGDFTPVLSAERRAIISANMPGEDNPPVFAEFFLRGLESGRADGQDAPEAGKKDGRITLLEAYHWATWNTAQWVARQKKVDENLWRVDGKESVAIFRKLCAAKPGERGFRRLAGASDASKPDETVRLKMRGQKDEIVLSHTRVLTEHAAIEDCGAEEPVSALASETEDWAPLTGTGEAEPGCLARRVVLGRPALLPAEGAK